MSKVYVAVGHGVRPDGIQDPGATGGGWTEQGAGDFIVAEAARVLRSLGVTVVDEAFRADPNFPGTIQAANGWGADYIVEVHHDWSKAPIGAFGHWYTDDGKRLADDIQRAVGAAGFPLRPAWHKRRTDLTLLKATNMPAVIYEVGRIGQETLNTKSELVAMGAAIAKGIAAHVGAQPRPEPEPEPEPVIVVDYGEEDRERLNRDLARSLGFSFDLKIIKSFLRGDGAEALDALEREKLAAVNRERQELGLEAAGQDSLFRWAVLPPPRPVPGFTLDTPVAGVVEMTTGELAERLPAEAVYNRVDVATAYREWCAKFGLRLDVVWAQMILETDGLRYTGDVDPGRTRHNFCGLKDGLGLGWASFTSITLGVVAHCAHLAAYVHPNHVLPECNRVHDPRHPENHQTWQEAHGAIVKVADFGGGRWAEDTEYAAKLVRVWERGA